MTTIWIDVHIMVPLYLVVKIGLFVCLNPGFISEYLSTQPSKNIFLDSYI